MTFDKQLTHRLNKPFIYVDVNIDTDTLRLYSVSPHKKIEKIMLNGFFPTHHNVARKMVSFVYGNNFIARSTEMEKNRRMKTRI